jgi:hypothetical protein
MEAEQMERVEVELDRIAEKRARERRGADATEELWRPSACLHEEKLLRENRALWHGYHAHMRNVHQRLADEHARKASNFE